MRNKVDSIVKQIKWNINSGIYGPAEKLPSEHQLAIKFNISRITARKVLQLLKTDGIVVSSHGRGYFVSSGQRKMLYEPRNGKAGELVKFHIINNNILDNQKDIFKSLTSLDINFDDYKFTFMKTNFNAHQKPYSVLHSFLNTSILQNITNDDLEIIKESLAAYLGKKNINVTKRVEKIMVILAPQIVDLKLKISSKQYVVAAYSIMVANNKVIELAIRYTLLDEFSQIYEKDY